MMSNAHKAVLTALVTFAIATAAAYLFPSVELQVFARTTAEIAGLLSGAPAITTPDGWLLPFQHQALLISEACSGAGFFIMLASLLAWHLAKRWGRVLPALVVGLSASFALAMGINALRVLSLSQAHRWLIPLLPETYAHVAHLMVGVAVFLPALIALNTAFEIYGHPSRRHSSQSPN